MRLLISCLFIIAFLISCKQTDKTSNLEFDVIIIGGGASGVTAGLQSGKLGANTLILEETEWLGGMLTSAGVSAIDGNNKLPSGLWGEFRDSLSQRYGGRKALETGWVSNTLFEPSVAQDIFRNMTSSQTNLQVLTNQAVLSVVRDNDHWQIITKDKSYLATIIIDATELGDIAKKVGISYDIGMQDGESEPLGPQESNDIIQDPTWVAILQDFGPDSDKTIDIPKNYDPLEFDCACNTGKPEIDAVNCQTMLNYGKLPNNKYMINWPNCGNDIYINALELSSEERHEAFVAAKEMTKRFVYYIQNDLGFRHLGLAEEEFPSMDLLPLIPYHRESRRIHGEVRLLSKHLSDPYNYKLYKTGIAVGDYPIDHHHKKNPDAPKIDFIGIKIPSYSIPLGALLPHNLDNFIVAEKSISVSNIVNGATRLQPVVLGIGQAAGAIAATAIKQQKSVKEVGIREVQSNLLNHDAYLLPFIDVKPSDPDFAALQKAGAIGLFEGKGIPYKWANQTWAYPDTAMLHSELAVFAEQFGIIIEKARELVSPRDLIKLLVAIDPSIDSQELITRLGNSIVFLTRREVAVAIDRYTSIFDIPIDYQGNTIQK